MVDKLVVLLDSSPLITLCTAKIGNKPIIRTVLDHANVVITEQVNQELLKRHEKSDVRIVRPLISGGQISVRQAPDSPIISNFYLIGETDCSIIRLGLSVPEMKTIIDDKEEYLIACRYGLRPTFLLDLMVLLVESRGLDRKLARNMVESMAKRYSPAYVAHTLEMLR